MNCPKCDRKIKTDQTACSYCGTTLAKINNASYVKAVEVLNKGNLYEKESLFYLTKMPTELSRKKMLLFTIFLGLFGAHDMYVGKKKFGISKLISFILGEIVAVVCLFYQYESLTLLAGLLLLYPFAFWLYDVLRVIVKKYPYPYIME